MINQKSSNLMVASNCNYMWHFDVMYQLVKLISIIIKCLLYIPSLLHVFCSHKHSFYTFSQLPESIVLCWQLVINDVVWYIVLQFALHFGNRIVSQLHSLPELQLWSNQTYTVYILWSQLTVSLPVADALISSPFLVSFSFTQFWICLKLSGENRKGNFQTTQYLLKFTILARIQDFLSTSSQLN